MTRLAYDLFRPAPKDVVTAGRFDVPEFVLPMAGALGGLSLLFFLARWSDADAVFHATCEDNEG